MTHEYTLFVNGRVLTMAGASHADPIGNRATAVAIAGDRILAVGTDDDARAISGGDSSSISADERSPPGSRTLLRPRSSKGCGSVDCR
jgi:predicted amidohydrolase YtcJ